LLISGTLSSRANSPAIVDLPAPGGPFTSTAIEATVRPYGPSTGPAAVVSSAFILQR
jgi:hypothetical protein